MSVYIHFLKTNSELAPFEAEIKNRIHKTIKTVSEIISLPSVDVVIQDSEFVIKHLGIGGNAYLENPIFISINSKFKPISTPLHEIPGTLSHELNHILRSKKPGYGKTLFEAMISEGLADHFELEITHKTPQRWDIALSVGGTKTWMDKARREFNNENYDHNSWFFGDKSKKIPKWVGYSLGYYIVEKYLKDNNRRASEIVNVEAEKFLEYAN